MKTSELIGPALDWAVAKCEGIVTNESVVAWKDGKWFHPSIDWSQGGPIIEREKINFGWNDALQPVAWRGYVSDYDTVPMFYGTSLLIAAMRCFVASKLGDEVDVPEELK